MMKNSIICFFVILTLCCCTSDKTDKERMAAVDSITGKAIEMTDSVMKDYGRMKPSITGDEESKAEDDGTTDPLAPNANDAEADADTLLNLTPQQVDSLVFRLSHHYSENFNFLVKADSLTLVPREGDMLIDTCKVYDGDLIVVASIKSLPGDSIDSVWVKVAHDQYTMGWIPEHELLKGAIPDDSISEMLYALTGSRGFWMSALVLLGVVGFFLRKGKVKKLQILRFDEMDSFYPLLFLTAVAVMAGLYASVQNFVPEFWQEYYFHPTLNPLQLPLLMSSLVVLMWVVVILYIAVIDEVYHNFYFMPGVAYLLELTGLAMVVYLIVSWTTLFYIGYVIASAAVIIGWTVYFRVKFKG